MSEDIIWRRPNKTVYILGAGFSKLARIPTIKEFIPQALQVLKADDDKKNLTRFCRMIDEYQTGAARLGLQLKNLEDLFCLIDLPSSDIEKEKKNGNKNLLIEVIINTVLKKFKRCCEKKCDEECCVPRRHFFQNSPDLKSIPIPHAKYGTCIYEAFLSYVLGCQNRCKEENELNTVITFNYDLVVERALDALGGAFVYYGDKIVNGSKDPKVLKKLEIDDYPKTLHYLKLHGSLNWISDSDFYTKIWIPQDIKQLLNKGIDKNKNECVPLIPPTWKRGSTDGNIFEKMVSQAIKHLQLASTIVIIGYSIPKYDIYFKYMFARALNTSEFPEIQVWDVEKRSKMLPRLEQVFGSESVREKKIQYFEGGLKAFVISHSYFEKKKDIKNGGKGKEPCQ